MLLRKRTIIFSVHEKNIFVKQIRRTGCVVRNSRGRGWNATYTACHPLTDRPIRVVPDTHNGKPVFWGEIFLA